MEQEKTCENCYYFYQHYYKSKHGKFMKVYGEGHCVNGELTMPAFKKIIAKRCICEFWQPKELQIVERRETVSTLILKMKTKLDEIAFLL